MKFFEAVSKAYGRKITIHNYKEVILEQRPVGPIMFFLPKGVTHKCKMCGKCCHQQITIFEGEKILNFASDVIKEEGEDKRVLGENKKPCPFLDECESKCTIYEDRPMVCRVYPIVPAMHQIAHHMLKTHQLYSFMFTFYIELGQLTECRGWEVGEFDEKAYVKENIDLLLNLGRSVGKLVSDKLEEDGCEIETEYIGGKTDEKSKSQRGDEEA